MFGGWCRDRTYHAPKSGRFTVCGHTIATDHPLSIVKCTGNTKDLCLRSNPCTLEYSALLLSMLGSTPQPGVLPDPLTPGLSCVLSARSRHVLRAPKALVASHVLHLHKTKTPVSFEFPGSLEFMCNYIYTLVSLDPTGFASRSILPNSGCTGLSQDSGIDPVAAKLKQ